MVSDLLCPDCGGVVGATETTEEGPPCRCFVGRTDDADESVVDADAPVVVKAKICRVCKIDVTGKKRVRDQYGYYCYDCHKAEELKNNQGRVRCGACGHLVRPEALVDYEGTKMCPTCHTEQLEVRKQVIRQMGNRAARNRYEGKQALVWVCVLTALLLVIIFSVIYVHFRHA